MTICVECAHCVKTDPAPIWYNFRCSALPQEGERDPVTGIAGYPRINDLGGTYYDSCPYPYCRDINKGDCPMFEKKPTRLGRLARLLRKT